jgi:hypothetical protein
MTLNPIPGTALHNMIVEGLSMPAALKERLKPILAAKGESGEPVSSLESVTSCEHRVVSSFLDREIPGEPEVIELFKQLVGVGPLPPHGRVRALQ